MKTKLDYLFLSEPPWITIGPGEVERVKWITAHFYSKPGCNVCTRRLRGNKMRIIQGLMDEFAAALQFFDGFGENWTALKECLDYLDEWMPADAYVLVVERSEELLAEESPDQMIALLKTLHEVGDWWSKPVVNNDRFNRRAIPFHVLLNVSDGGTVIAERIVELAKEAQVPVRI